MTKTIPARLSWLLFAILFLGFAPSGLAEQSDFLSLCQVTLADQNGSSTCKRLHLQFFAKNDTKHFAPLTPQLVGAPAMAVDKKVQFLVFNDPNYVPGIAYCYSVFKKWIRPAEISPDAFGQSLSGFTILNEDLKEYQQWLDKAPDGKSCKLRVEQESQVPVANLEASLKNVAALIAVNPYALVREKGADYNAIIHEMVVTLNHERVHAYQVLCPDFEKWSQQHWRQLPKAQKDQVIRSHPEYNWQDPKVAGREYAAYQLENKIQTLPNHLGQCRF